MFEVRCFHLGKVEGLFLGQGLPSCGGSSNSGLLLWGQGGSQEQRLAEGDTNSQTWPWN